MVVDGVEDDGVDVGGAGSAGGGGSAGSGSDGSGSDGSGAGSSAPLAPLCGPNEVGFGGIIDGIPLLYNVALKQPFSTLDFTGSSTASDGMFVFAASNSFDPITHLGFMRLPSTPASTSSPLPSNPGQWLCAPDMPLAETSLGTEFVLSTPVTVSGLRRLGTCPGTPIGGQIVCNDVECDLGEIGGTMTGGWNDPSLMAFFEGGLIFDTTAESGGVLLLPRDHPDAEALYCIGSSSVDDNGFLTLGKLSRLGKCAEGEPVSGAITVCEEWQF